MTPELELLGQLKRLVSLKQYRVRIHAVRHMIEEGFTEDHLIGAITERSRILENYPDESRCLILGYFRLTEKVRSPLHIVCDYSNLNLVDIVTAYIPDKSWWETPTRRR